MYKKSRRIKRPALRGMIWAAMSFLVCVALISATFQRLQSAGSSSARAEVRGAEAGRTLPSAPRQATKQLATLRDELRAREDELQAAGAEVRGLEKALRDAAAAAQPGRAGRVADPAAAQAEIAARQSALRTAQADMQRLQAELRQKQQEQQRQMEDSRRTQVGADTLTARARGLQEEIAGLRVRGKKAETRKNVVTATSIHGVASNREGSVTFAECSKAGVLVKPLNRRLSADPSAADKETFQQAAGESGYVVFMVRPDGLGTFQHYRTLIEEANGSRTSKIEMGYEPIDAAWELVYPGEE
jgi:Skp family chaperone for outer membrane proteins